MENKVKIDLAELIQGQIENKIRMNFEGKEYDIQCMCSIYEGTTTVEITIDLQDPETSKNEATIVGTVEVLEVLANGGIDLDEFEGWVHNA